MLWPDDHVRLASRLAQHTFSCALHVSPILPVGKRTPLLPALPLQAMELLKLMYDTDADFTNTFRCGRRRRNPTLVGLWLSAAGAAEPNIAHAGWGGSRPVWLGIP